MAAASRTGQKMAWKINGQRRAQWSSAYSTVLWVGGAAGPHGHPPSQGVGEQAGKDVFVTR